MNIFLSWSGKTSHRVALVLHSWLKKVIHQAEPFLSSKDIDIGQNWNDELGERIRNSKFAIICVTKFNMASKWLNFEAGALGRYDRAKRVCPFLVGITNADLQGPLTQFQAVVADHDKEAVRSLVGSIKTAGNLKTDDATLSDSFERYYPDLIQEIEAITKHATEDVSERNARVVKQNTLFVSTPMAALNDNDYDSWRGGVIPILQTIRDRFGFNEVYCCIEDISGRDEFEDNEVVAAKDLLQVQQSEYFLTLYPGRICSSILVEIGYAIALNKKVVIVVNRRNELPYILTEADRKIGNLKIYEIGSAVEKSSDWFAKKGRAMFDFERF